MKNNFWFKNKTYGWGWTPANWKGWATTLLYCLILIGYPFLSSYGFYAYSELVFIPLAVISTALFIFICFKKGEKPEWRWGKDR